MGQLIFEFFLYFVLDPILDSRYAKIAWNCIAAIVILFGLWAFVKGFAAVAMVIWMFVASMYLLVWYQKNKRLAENKND